MKRHVLHGVEMWKNPKNGFFVFQLHYEADPKKREPGYIDMIKNAMPKAQFQQEYNLVWDSFAGMPVYPDFDVKAHISAQELHPVVGLPLLRGWDFGLTPAAVIAQYVEERLIILKEFTEVNMGADRFSDKVLAECSTMFPGWSDPRKGWIDCIDPSGEFRKDTDEGTCAKILDSKGLQPIPGPVAFEERKKSVEWFLFRRNRHGICFQVNEEQCPVLVRGFRGGYRYPEKSADIEPNKIRPLKDEHSHSHDALQYIASRVRMVLDRPKLAIPKLSYGWNQVRN